MKTRLTNNAYKAASNGKVLHAMKTIEATLLEAGATTSDYTILDLLTAGLKLVEIEAQNDLVKQLEDSDTVRLGIHIGRIANILENWE